MYLHSDPAALIASLVDNVGTERDRSGYDSVFRPGLRALGQPADGLQLVQSGLTNAALFTADGQVIQPADAFYKKCILVERGSFRPVTKVTLDMLRCAQAHLRAGTQRAGRGRAHLMEMTLKNLTDGDKIDHQDFLDRVDILGALGKTVLISNFGEYHRLAAYFFRYTKKMIGMAMGVPTLKEIFDEKYYADLERRHSGILWPHVQKRFEALCLSVAGSQNGRAHHRGQFARRAQSAPSCTPIWWRTGLSKACATTTKRRCPFFPATSCKRSAAGDTTWEAMVPAQVAKMIRERKLFGCKGPCSLFERIFRAPATGRPPPHRCRW